MTSVSLITTYEDFLTLAEPWHKLASAMPHATIFQSFAWHRAFIEAFDCARRLRIYVARDGETITAILPATIYQRTVNGTSHSTLGFIGAENYLSDYCDALCLVSKDLSLSAILDTALSDRSVSLVEFQNLRPESCALKALSTLTGKRMSQVVNLHAYAADLTDKTFAQSLTKKKSLKRHYNYFARDGGVAVRHLTSAADIHPRLEGFFQQHIGRRKLCNDTSIFEEQPFRTFFTRLPELFEPTGELRFSLIEHQGSVLAYHYGFVDRGRVIWYKPTFDAQLAEHSPGEVLLKSLLEYSIELAATEFDFTVGDEAFKLRFSNISRPVTRVRVYRCTLPYLLERGREMLKSLKRRFETSDTRGAD